MVLKQRGVKKEMAMTPGDTRTGMAFPAGSAVVNAAANIRDGCTISPAASTWPGLVLII